MQSSKDKDTFPQRFGLRRAPSGVPNAGLGLFATRDFRQAEFVAALVISTRWNSNASFGNVREAVDLTKRVARMDPAFLTQNGVPEAWLDAMSDPSATGSKGDATRLSMDFALGSNDGDLEMPSEDEPLQESMDKIRRYVERFDGVAPGRNNCGWEVFESPLLPDVCLKILRTTRPVANGEEIFRPYGLCCWEKSLLPFVQRHDSAQQAARLRGDRDFVVAQRAFVVASCLFVAVGCVFVSEFASEFRFFFE